MGNFVAKEVSFQELIDVGKVYAQVKREGIAHKYFGCMNYSTVFSGYTNERGSKDRSVLRCIMKTFALEKDPKIQHAGLTQK